MEVAYRMLQEIYKKELESLNVESRDTPPRTSTAVKINVILERYIDDIDSLINMITSTLDDNLVAHPRLNTYLNGIPDRQHGIREEIPQSQHLSYKEIKERHQELQSSYSKQIEAIEAVEKSKENVLLGQVAQLNTLMAILIPMTLRLEEFKGNTEEDITRNNVNEATSCKSTDGFISVLTDSGNTVYDDGENDVINDNEWTDATSSPSKSYPLNVDMERNRNMNTPNESATVLKDATDNLKRQLAHLAVFVEKCDEAPENDVSLAADVKYSYDHSMTSNESVSATFGSSNADNTADLTEDFTAQRINVDRSNMSSSMTDSGTKHLDGFDCNYNDDDDVSISSVNENLNVSEIERGILKSQLQTEMSEKEAKRSDDSSTSSYVETRTNKSDPEHEFNSRHEVTELDGTQQIESSQSPPPSLKFKLRTHSIKRQYSDHLEMCEQKDSNSHEHYTRQNNISDNSNASHARFKKYMSYVNHYKEATRKDHVPSGNSKHYYLKYLTARTESLLTVNEPSKDSVFVDDHAYKLNRPKSEDSQYRVHESHSLQKIPSVDIENNIRRSIKREIHATCDYEGVGFSRRFLDMLAPSYRTECQQMMKAVDTSLKHRHDTAILRQQNFSQ